MKHAPTQEKTIGHFAPWSALVNSLPTIFPKAKVLIVNAVRPKGTETQCSTIQELISLLTLFVLLFLSSFQASAASVIDPSGATYAQASASSVFNGSYTAANLFKFNVSSSIVGTALPDASEWAVAGPVNNVYVTNAYVAFDLGSVHTASSIYYAQRASGSPPVDMMNVARIWASQTTPFNPNNPPANAPNTVVIITNFSSRVWTEYLFTNNIIGRYFLVNFIQTSGAGYAPGGDEMRLGEVLSNTQPTTTLGWSISPSGLTLTWSGPWLLMNADEATGPWGMATGVTSGVPIPMSSARQFYRLQRSQYWINAQNVHNFVVNYLLTPYSSYRIETNSSTAYAWYNASQMYADSAMVASGDTNYASYMNGTFTWMSNLWDTVDPSGGYWAAANIDGTGATGSGMYVDDNSLIGNVYLDCYAVSSGATKTNYLDSARAAANWLMFSGQWDNTFGGGFWWDLTKQNKPTQSNGLAMQLFLRLYQITGQTYYRDWANSIESWLDTQMYNPADGLYVWQITTNGTPSGLKSSVEFTYDNGIMIEADLLYYQVMSNSVYRTKAQNLANSLNTKLWNNTYGSYYLDTTVGSVNPTWCGWASQSFIKLYQVDGNTNWLNYAQRNIDFMNSHLKNNNIGGYFYFCNIDGSGVTTYQMEGVDQAWMQRIQAMLSNYR